MGYLTAEPTTEVQVVHTALGKLGAGVKARVWLLADRSVVVCTVDGGVVTRTSHDVLASQWDRRAKLLTVQLDGGGVLVLDAKGCGCNMGKVANAAPIDGRYHLVRIRTPEWHVIV
jgi:hypothetical protein